MSTKQQTERYGNAIAELEDHCPDLNSRQVVQSLTGGLTYLRNLFMVRARDDVTRKYGTDSMVGISLAELEKQAQVAKTEIEAYSCIVVADEATQSGYVDDTDEWFLEWMFRLRLGEGYESVFDKRVDFYRSKTIEDRRLKFVKLLQRAIPESARAPLVLFRLFPRSVRILTAVAFGDPLRAQDLRAEQTRFLPDISYCHECHGRVFDNGDHCACCGNPVWNYAFLLAE